MGVGEVGGEGGGVAYRVLVLEGAVAHAGGRFPKADGVVEARSAQNHTALAAGHGGREEAGEGKQVREGSTLSEVSCSLATHGRDGAGAATPSTGLR